MAGADGGAVVTVRNGVAVLVAGDLLRGSWAKKRVRGVLGKRRAAQEEGKRRRLPPSGKVAECHSASLAAARARNGAKLCCSGYLRVWGGGVGGVWS